MYRCARPTGLLLLRTDILVISVLFVDIFIKEIYNIICFIIVILYLHRRDVTRVKKVLSLVLILALICSVASTLGVTAQAAMIDTEYGSMQDTSDPSNGTVYWAFSYNRYRGTATLTLTGDGYMPNDVWSDSWLPIQYAVQCYITEVVVQDGVKSIMERAFAGEIKLSKVTMADSVESIGDGAFANTALTSFNVPAGVKELSYNSFIGSPIRSYTVDPDNQTYCSYNGALYSEDMKTLVVAPAGKWTSDPDYDFVIPETVERIDKGAFAYTGVKHITIPSNVKSIGNMAFYDNPLTTVDFRNGIEYIYDSAFLSCPDLKAVHIPSSIKYIGTYAFGYDYVIDYTGIKMFLDNNGIKYGTLNEDNVEGYLEQIGYTLEAFEYLDYDPNVTIYAPSGSAANKYAVENGLKYIRSQALTPTLISAISGDDGMTVSWTRSDDAVGYYVYRKNLNNVWERIAIVRGADNTSYHDKGAFAGKKNTYTVRAYNTLGQSYCYQSGVSGTFVPYVKLKAVANNVGGVRVSWEKWSGVEYYSIYRKAEGQTVWQYVGKSSKNASSYLDTTADGNKTYVYTVKGTVGSIYGTYDKDGLEVTYVEAPEFSVYNITNGIAIKWSHNDYADCFRIYRKTNGGAWQLIKVADSNETVYYDKAVARGTAYTYTVRAVYNGALSCYYPEGKTIVSIDAPMDINAESRVSGALVSWNKCAGAQGYYIYRKGATGGFKQIAKVTSGSTLTYLDTTAKAGETYSYTVRAYNGASLSTYNLDGKVLTFIYTPRLSSAKSTKDGVIINYTKSAGCDGYYIYRRVAGSSWLRIATVKGADSVSYLDKSAQKGTEYIYTVKAFKGSLMSSYFANGITVKDVY